MSNQDMLMAMKLTEQTRTVRGIFKHYDKRYQILTIDQYENDITKTHEENYFVKNEHWSKQLEDATPGETVFEISCPLVICFPMVDTAETERLEVVRKIREQEETKA